MKEIRTEDAVGHILCHDITQIIKDEKKGVLFKKGHVVKDEDIPLLLSVGKEHLFVWEKKPGILHENEAAEILYKICAGNSSKVHGTEIKEGKIEVVSKIDGILKIRRDALVAVNSLGEMMIASRHGDFPVKINGNDKFFHNLTEDEKQKFLDYKLDVKVCDGTEEEKLEWFKRINIAGLVLTNQELLNATYVGTWLADAKNYFSKRNCVAGQMAEGYIKGNPIRQDYLEKALAWIADRDGLESGQMYMAKHQHDLDANELWLYFQTVINWAKMLFPNARKGVTDVQDWGILYNEFHDKQYNSNSLETDMKQLLMDDDVTKNAGIIRYLLSDRTKHDEKFLSIRAFSEAQKRRAYEKQEHKCAICGEVFDLTEMDGDHIVPWSQGGRTVDENLQMLCKKCNNEKSDR